MNPNLARLQPYLFEKLRALFAGIILPVNPSTIRLSVGEPQHPISGFIRIALVAGTTQCVELAGRIVDLYKNL